MRQLTFLFLSPLQCSDTVGLATEKGIWTSKKSALHQSLKVSDGPSPSWSNFRDKNPVKQKKRLSPSYITAPHLMCYCCGMARAEGRMQFSNTSPYRTHTITNTDHPTRRITSSGTFVARSLARSAGAASRKLYIGDVQMIASRIRQSDEHVRLALVTICSRKIAGYKYDSTSIRREFDKSSTTCERSLRSQ